MTGSHAAEPGVCKAALRSIVKKSRRCPRLAPAVGCLLVKTGLPAIVRPNSSWLTLGKIRALQCRILQRPGAVLQLVQAELAWESRCRKSSTAVTSAEIATAEPVLQSPADAAHEQAPAPAEVWLLIRQACQQ